jgi:hypothetical protein
MTRIAAAVLIVLGVLNLNGELGRPAFADSLAVRPATGVDVTQPLAIRSSRVLGLILALEALRQVPVSPAPQKG